MWNLVSVAAKICYLVQNTRYDDILSGLASVCGRDRHLLCGSGHKRGERWFVNRQPPLQVSEMYQISTKSRVRIGCRETIFYGEYSRIDHEGAPRSIREQCYRQTVEYSKSFALSARDPVPNLKISSQNAQNAFYSKLIEL